MLHQTPADDRGTHQRLAPSPALAPYLAHFWSVTWQLEGRADQYAEVLPHPSVHLAFEAHKARVLGVPTKKFGRWLRGNGDVLGIKFRPATFRLLFGRSVATLTGRTPSLISVFGRSAAKWVRAMFDETSFETRIELSEAFLVPRLPPMTDEVARLRDLVERMASDATLITVEQAAEVMGVDRRTLERKFKDAVGVPPKWVIRRYRLHEAAAQLQQPGADLGQIALALGYFDQSHFTRDFKATVGRPPGAFLAERSQVRYRR